MDDPVRRKDRDVSDDDAWIEAFLARAATGVLAVAADARPQLNANLFVYEPGTRAIYVHTARHGATRRGAEAEEHASFACFEMGRILPARRAIGFSVEYASVIAHGRLAIIEGPEASHALRRFMEKYAPHLEYGKDYDGVTEADLARTSVYRLAVEEWRAKRNAKPRDEPGAYPYGGPYPPPGPVADTENP